MDELCDEVWMGDDSGVITLLATFLRLDDARAFARRGGGTVLDVQEQTVATYYLRDAAATPGAPPTPPERER